MPTPEERARLYRARAEECLRLSILGNVTDTQVQYFRHLAQCYAELALAEESRADEEPEPA